MNYLKLFEDYFPYRHEMSDEEFQIVWDYFCFYVFPKERIKLMNQIILDTIEEVEFLDFTDLVKGRDLKLNPYFGLKNAKKGGTYMGLSYEFRKEVNNETFNRQSCKGWNHLFKDAFNRIQLKSYSNEHGVPYYEYIFELSIVEPWNGKPVEELQKILTTRESWNDITQYISSTIERFANHYDADLSVSTKGYGNNGVFEKNSYKFEIRLEDFDFEPKPDSEVWK